MPTLTLAINEARRFYRLPAAWVLLAAGCFLLGWLFLSRIDPYLAMQADLAKLANPPGVTELVIAPTFTSSALILLALIPLLSMRTLAEERRQRTFNLLASAPLSSWQIVLGKYLGLMFTLLPLIALTALLPFSLLLGGKLDLGLVTANILGFVLLATAFAAAGVFTSSLSAHPALAAFGGLLLLLIWSFFPSGAAELGNPLELISPLKQFEPFNQGLIDSAGLVYFPLVTLLFLALTVLRLEHLKRAG